MWKFQLFEYPLREILTIAGFGRGYLRNYRKARPPHKNAAELMQTPPGTISTLHNCKINFDSSDGGSQTFVFDRTRKYQCLMVFLKALERNRYPSAT